MRPSFRRAEPDLTTHPTALSDGHSRVQSVAALTRNPDHGRVPPQLTAPGLVLVAAFAIFTGYHWLHLLPNGSSRPTALLFALFAVPATFALTHHVDAPHVHGARFVARICAAIGLVLGFVEAVDHNWHFSWVLGVASLVLAMALVSLAYASERNQRPPAHNH